jgi:hypothetical protein
MSKILEKDIVRTAESLFANTSSYYFNGGFANRESTKKELSRIVDRMSNRDSGVDSIAISDLLGSGKTFLIQELRDRIGSNPATAPTEISRDTFLDDLANRVSQNPPFVVIDEVDNKTPRIEVLEKLRRASEIVNPREGIRAPVVVLGDYSLKDQRIWTALGRSQKFLPLEPLDSRFFLLALTLRLRHCLNDQSIDDENTRSLFEPDFLRRLIPELGYPCAVFRQSLEVLQVIGTDILTSSSAPAVFTLGHFEKYLKQQDFLEEINDTLSDPFRKFTKWINDLDTGETWKIAPLSLPEFSETLKIGGSVSPVDEVVVPFVRAGLLRYFGVPYVTTDDDDSRYPGPYFPSPLAFLAASILGVH